MPGRPDWWREAVVYQVYPRSFQDSDGDGIGDLQGLIARLDYLNDGTPRSLGVDAIWLSPTFPSPMADFGYDVADYCDVHPDFGDLEAMDRLVSECHARGIRVLLDFVPNHTSDQHPWFIESRSSRDNPRRDWYFWRDPKPDGSPPNNWISMFGGPGWTFDEATGQYYLHSFLKEQPDLNWRNPEVERAMHNVLRFWLDRGIDGFRIDVMGMIIKHPDLADNPPDPDWHPGDTERRPQLLLNNRNYPEVYPAVQRLRAVFDEYDGRVAVGEVFGSSADVARYYGEEDRPGLHLAFNFQLIHVHNHVPTPWEATTLRRVVTEADAALAGARQPCFTLGNHDRVRFISRHDADGHGHARARAAILLLLGLRNTPFIYYGEEIGMEDVPVPPELQVDPARFRSIGRDSSRTPMPWDSSPGRGFSTGTPWLPYGPLIPNVAAQEDDPDSMLNLYRRAIWLRKSTPALLRGRQVELPAPGGVFAWTRILPGAPAVAVAVNTADSPREVALHGGGTVILSTDRRQEGTALRDGVLRLEPLGAAIVRQPL